jgi:hypothetical protein
MFWKKCSDSQIKISIVIIQQLRCWCMSYILEVISLIFCYIIKRLLHLKWQKYKISMFCKKCSDSQIEFSIVIIQQLRCWCMSYILEGNSLIFCYIIKRLLHLKWQKYKISTFCKKSSDSQNWICNWYCLTGRCHVSEETISFLFVIERLFSLKIGEMTNFSHFCSFS